MGGQATWRFFVQLFLAFSLSNKGITSGQVTDSDVYSSSIPTAVRRNTSIVTAPELSTKPDVAVTSQSPCDSETPPLVTSAICYDNGTLWVSWDVPPARVDLATNHQRRYLVYFVRIHQEPGDSHDVTMEPSITLTTGGFIQSEISNYTNLTTPSLLCNVSFLDRPCISPNCVCCDPSTACCFYMVTVCDGGYGPPSICTRVTRNHSTSSSRYFTLAQYIGLCVGGVTLIIVLLLVCGACCWRRRTKRKQSLTLHPLPGRMELNVTLSAGSEIPQPHTHNATFGTLEHNRCSNGSDQPLYVNRNAATNSCPDRHHVDNRNTIPAVPLADIHVGGEDYYSKPRPTEDAIGRSGLANIHVGGEDYYSKPRPTEYAIERTGNMPLPTLPQSPVYSTTPRWA